MDPVGRQRDAIEAPLGPVLVLAGPGAGKTFCLIGRIWFLVTRYGFPPERICALTFTNKAAEEIDQRLRSSIGSEAAAVTRGTVHALCASILRDHAHEVGLSRGFGIADEDYQREVLRKLRVASKRHRQLLILFGRRRLDAYRLSRGDEALFQEYVAQLRRHNLVDFDDLIALTAQLMQKNPRTAEEISSRWDYILVDEFQDLDPAQYLIIRRLAERHRNIFAVGDDEQSIFSWRGAHPDLLRSFQSDFAIDRPIVLALNLRCASQIFATARRLAEVNRPLFSKEISAHRKTIHPVQAYVFPDEKSEASWIIADLIADREVSDLGWGDYAVLFRTHKIGAELESCFVQAGIPCRMSRRRSLADDPVIGWVTAALRVMLNSQDDLAVEAFAAKALPEALLERVRSEGQRLGLSFLAAVRHYALRAPRAEPDTRRAWRFVYQVENLAATYRSHQNLSSLGSDLLAAYTGPYRNRLEEHQHELSDPAGDPAAVALCQKIRLTVSRDSRLWIEPMGGLEIALQGMLFNAGLSSVQVIEGDRDLHSDDLVLSRADAGELGLPVTLFKALQLLHTADLDEGLKDYVTFDLESTDRDPSRCEIVELGAARVRSGQVVDTFHSLVRPQGPVSAEASKIHGYTEQDLASAPEFEVVWPHFRAFVSSDVLVAHNGHRFDVPVLRRAAQSLGGVDDLVFFDTYPLARSLIRGSVKLQELAAAFGIERGRAHHALDDALTLAAVVQGLERLKQERTRKVALGNLLDYLALALVLDGVGREGDGEPSLLLQLGAPYALGRYSDCLEVYARERDRRRLAEAPPLEAIVETLGGRKLMERLRAERDAARRYPEAVARLQQLIEASQGESLEESVHRLLELVALSSSEGAEVDPHRVNLLTLHSTKGLEFSRVYIVGVEDCVLPGWRALAEGRDAEIEEARRLLYVGMTRAKDRLVLTRCRTRHGGDAGGNKFLDEMGLVPVEKS